jgi:methylglyoxal synthase
MQIKIYNSQTNQELQEFDLVAATRATGKCTVGRSANCGLTLDSTDVSRNHAEFTYRNGQYYFADTGSTNGSLVNNQLAIKQQTYLLKAGDVLKIGEFLLIPQPVIETYEEATVLAPVVTPSPVDFKATMVEAAEEIAVEPVIASAGDFSEMVAEVPIDFKATMFEEELPEAAPEAFPEVAAEAPIDFKATMFEEELPEVPALTDEAPIDFKATMFEEELPEAAPEAFPEVAAEAPIDFKATMFEEELPEVPALTEEAIAAPPEAFPEAMAAESAVASSETEAAPMAAVDILEEMPEEMPAAMAVAETPVEEVAPIPDMVLPDVWEAPEVPAQPEIAAVVEAPPEIEIPPVEEIVPEVVAEEVAVAPTEAIASPQPSPSDIPEILQQKHIVLLAHDSQKTELATFVGRYSQIFSKCLLMTPAATSDVFAQENGISVSRKIASLASGGYQEVNFAIASGEVLAVIFLRDFMTPQTTQANDEALSRSCNVNQVIFATNLATAEAIAVYLQQLLSSAA